MKALIPAFTKHALLGMICLLGWQFVCCQQYVSFSYVDDKGEKAEGSLGVRWRAIKTHHHFFDFSKISQPELNFYQAGPSYLELTLWIERWGKNFHRRVFEVVFEKPEGEPFPGLRWEAPRELSIHRNGTGEIRFRVLHNAQGTITLPFGIRSTETGELQTGVAQVSKAYRLNGLEIPTPSQDAKAAWETTQKLGSREAYLRFLDQYGDSPFAAAANDTLDQLLWERVSRTDNPQAYAQYLKDRPAGRYAAQARIILADREAWDKAMERSDMLGFETYLKAFPEGRYREEATQYLAKLRPARRSGSGKATATPAQAAEVQAWQAAQRLGTIEAYSRFIEQFPESGTFRKQAETAIARLQPMEVTLSREQNRFTITLEQVNHPNVLDVFPTDSISYRWLSREPHRAELLVELSGKGEYQLTLVDRDNEQKTLSLSLDATPLQVSNVRYDADSRKMSFQVSGGKKPYAVFFQQKDGSLLSSPLPLDVDTGFQLGQLLPLIRRSNDASVEVYLTDASRLEQVLITRDLPLPVSRGWPLWAILLGPLLISLFYLFIRNRRYAAS